MHVVDTDVCVDALRGLPEAIDELAALEVRGPLAISAITAHELWQGAFGSEDPEHAGQGAAGFLAAFEVLPYDEDVASIGARSQPAYERAGNGSGIWIP